ncbi:NRDE family protein [Vibrio hannami]|uniref:NRDE family protein n=1 Tax=Vibrio hannami TaxID=2717094 RepID=UPI002410B27C|nr:NRDE family protein [Vibrio hannami]MDG3085942.1 NRDE family protein [Vibrio hannami]
MCTASWLLEEDGFQLFFNRDEQVGRVLATPPQLFDIDPDNNHASFLMPVDPQGGGSWIAVNEFGLAVCLLNYYQGEVPKGELISRGQLVKNFSSHQSSESLIKEFTQIDFSKYAPFTFMVFDSALSKHNGHVKALRWDGNSIIEFLAQPPMISSAVDAETVHHTRSELFHTYQAEGDTVESRLAFHHSHHPEQGHLSPCMHREDAHTVSFTLIKVSYDNVSMSYQEGAPCLQNPYQHKQLKRRHTEKMVQVSLK